MIVLRNLTFARAAKTLVDSASLQLGPGWKIGLTGGNGSGKSSFFALLTGALHAEKGDLDVPASWVIGHVAQETPALPDPALAFVLDGDVELREIERALVAAETAHDDASSGSETSFPGAEGSADSWRGNSGPAAAMTYGEKIGALHARLSEIGGYAAKARAAELLHGLGFSDADLARPVAEFSGGWRVRLNLARALMCRSDLLLLDEPTNHLDLDAVLWLEGWLRGYRGTLLMISHDRDFLDAVVGNILHIEQGGMKLYSGNYSAFERQRAAQLALQQAMFEKQQREIQHLHRFIDRFRAKATKARQAQSRMKALERMEEVAAAHVDTPFTFRFREPAAAPDPLLVLHEARAGYKTNAGEKIILDGIELTLRPGERIALLGRNGAGKSTLVKLLANELAPLAGQHTEGKGLAIGYFAQHQLEHLRPDESPLQHMQRLDPQTREQELRDYLGGFDFRGDMATAPCGKFSGGEKSRLALALLIWNKPNLLLLDEPTNHLDLEMREALTLALNEYEGGVVLVSHDRHLLRTTADTLLLVADGKVVPFDGDLDDYAGWLAAQREATTAPATETAIDKAADKAARIAAREQAAADRQAQRFRRRPLLKESEQLDRALQTWQREKATLDEALADPAIYVSPDRAGLEARLKRQAQLEADIATAEERWLEIQMELEALADR